MKIIDAGTLATTVTFQDGVKLCKQLKLIEFMRHGPHEYVRLTQKGINVAATLTEMLAQQAEATPDDILRGA
jgi:hypothetical protein